MASSRLVVVTGANSGIGFEAVKALLHSPQPYHIFLGSRSQEKGKEAIYKLQQENPDARNTLELLTVDLTNDDSISEAFETLKKQHDHIDILVNNAGAAFDPAYVAGKVSLRECFNKAYDVNLAGTHVLTHTFMPLLLKSTDPRLIFVTGLAGITGAAQNYYPTPPQPAGWPKKIGFETIGYRCTKVALNMLMLDWNHKLKEDGVKVWCLAPGMLRTNLGGGDIPEEILKVFPIGHASIGGKLVQEVIEGSRDADTGKIVGRDGKVVDW